MKGPFPIICRGHSGSRLLCEAFRQNNIWMGVAENDQRDSAEFGQRHRAVRYLVEKGFEYHTLRESDKAEVRAILSDLVERSRKNCPDPEAKNAYGWKRAIMTFSSEIVLDALPEAKLVHLIRDGRDVMLSRLDYRMGNLQEPINRLVVFGNAEVTSYRGISLAQPMPEKYRNELEMHHWVTAVRFGMRGRRYSGRYLEIRYEDLCANPERTMQDVCDFLDVAFLDPARQWLKDNASTSSIGKWRGREAELSEAIEIGAPLLAELGYM